MNREQLKKIFAHAKDERIDLFLEPLNETMCRYKIDTPLRQAHFLAQVGHESGELRYVKELASGKAYDTGRLAKALGNTPEEDGDGQKYKGRGLIQITGTANYRTLGADLGEDFLAHPELLETPHYAALSAGWFWNKKNLNSFADQDAIKTITKRINGGVNGLEDRKRLLEIAKKVLNV
jgi:putative chitinase